MCEEIPPLAPGMEPKHIAGLVVHQTVVADAISSGTRYAKARASKHALDKLQGLTPKAFRAKYGCDCRPQDGGEQAQLDIGTAI